MSRCPSLTLCPLALIIPLALALSTLAPPPLRAAPGGVRFTASAEAVDVSEYVELEISVDGPDAANPFTDVEVEGELQGAGAVPVRVEGFCDAADGSVFRVRLLPVKPGPHRYRVRYRQGDFESSHEGTFVARDAGRRGIVRVDPEHPWHFVWSGTGEHYFWNGTTTYWLMGWDDETIRRNIDRLHRLQVNRLRVVINGRVRDGRAWYENVFPTDRFRFILNPWVAARPDDVENPGFDVRRFNLEHWRKYERLLRHARERDMVVSVIFHVDGARPGVDPFGKERMGGEDEQRYYRYALARFAAFSNVMWDVTNEYHLFRNEAWTEAMGGLIDRCDPYGHLTSVHGHGDFPFRTSPWADLAMYQQWDEGGGHDFLLRHRRTQAGTGRPIPQVNEEYGYEDHYPKAWGGGRVAPARSADNRRRLAWGMYMAGGYQTTGERADRGTGWGPDSGGGWINGRGDETMVMLEGYGRIVDFFTGIDWWRLEPDPDMVEARVEATAKAQLTHIAYVRDAEGRATFYLDGAPKASGTIPGDLSSWSDDFRLALANELTDDRPWLGELRQVAIHARALRPEDVGARHRAGPSEPAKGAAVLFTFREGTGDIVRDGSGSPEPLDLRVETPDAVRWLPGGGLEIRAPARIRSDAAAKRLVEAIRKAGEISVEAWVRPASSTQTGPARIVTLSKNPSERDFTLGQAGPAYELRLRTTTTSPNGEPALRTPGGPDPFRQVAGMRTPEDDLAVIYFAAGGAATLKRDVSGLTATWYDPRSGEWKPGEVGPGGAVRAPDEQDWALLLSRDVPVFRDTFRDRLGPGWTWVREDPSGWRATPDGLELRVAPGNMWGPPNDARNVLVRPAPDAGGGAVEVTASILNRPAEQYEQVDLVWYHDDSNMVKIGQELVDGRLSIVMGREEKDRTRTIAIVPIAAARVELRFTVKDGRIRGQFREDASRPFTDAGECEVVSRDAPKISLQAYQGPPGTERWARITDFRVRRIRGAR